MKSFYQDHDNLEKHLDLLRQIEPTEVNFLTCHLDTRGDRLMVQKNFTSLQQQYRQGLDAGNRVDFDHAVKMIEVFLESLEPRSDAILFFCRGILGGQYFLPIPVSRPVANKIVFIPTPEVSGLIQLLKKTSDTPVTRHLNAGQPLPVNASRQLLSSHKHLARDDISYGISDDSHYWPAGAPLALRDPKDRLAVHPLDLVA